jgi:ankyrin repeat protein
MFPACLLPAASHVCCEPHHAFSMDIRPRGVSLAIRNLKPTRVLPAALILGCITAAMAAEIHDAVRGGDTATVARLLKKDAKLVNLADEKLGATPLYHAVDVGNLEIVRVLLNAGAKVNAKADDGMTPMLRAAAIVSPVKALEYLLEQGADPEVSALGFRPLHLAVKWGNAQVVKALIAHKADVNAAQVPAVDPPLHVAVFGGNMEIIRLLLDHGAKVNALGRNGSTALHHATWNDEIFNFLLERGADPKLQQSHGVTTLHMACQDGSAALVAKLLQLHPDLDAWDGAEFTPLLNAAEAGRVDLLKLLIAAGADLKAIQKNGRNALHLAAASANPEAVRFLLDQKLQVNAPSSSGDTPLMNAAAAGRLETVTLLLRAGASVNDAERNALKTALMVAANGPVTPANLPPDDRPMMNCGPPADYQKIVELLLTAGADLRARDSAGHTPLHWAAAAAGSSEIVALMISHGAQMDAKDRMGQTPLHLAAFSGDVASVTCMLDKGAALTARDSCGFLPLHCAARGNNLAVLEFLIAKGGDVAVTEDHGGTPLHLAVMDKKLGAARILLDHGAPPNARDQYQNSPLMLAATVGSAEMVRLLLDHRALVNGADAQGNTPLHSAAMVRVGRNEITPTAGEPEANAQLTLNAINNCPATDKLAIVKLLLAKGARPQVRNLEGATPVEFAEKFGTPEILAALKAGMSRPPAK